MRSMASSTAASLSSKSSAQISESRSTPSMSCVRSLEPIDTPSMPSAAYSGMRYDDRRHLGHHPAVQSAVRAERAGVDELEARLELPAGAHERDHEVQVRRLVADAGEDLQLESEQIGLAHVAVAAAVADHRVVLDRLERGAAFESAELVAAEVDRAVHDRPRCERTRDAQQRRRHAIDELSLAALRQELARVHAAERLGEHELGPEQADAVDGERRDRLGLVGDREVHVDARRERLGHDLGVGVARVRARGRRPAPNAPRSADATSPS